MAIPSRYEVTIQPLESASVYGAVIDVSDFINERDISQIKSGADSSDFDFGVFTYDSLSMKFTNFDGKFNEPGDSRSIFEFKRDLAKVTVKFFSKDETESSSFVGLINEEMSRVNMEDGTINIQILSLDSIIQNSIIATGTIATGVIFSTAIKTILNDTRVTSVLTFDASQIEVSVDLAIDDGAYFDNRNRQEALDLLLLAANAIFTVDKDTSTMVVKRRDDHSVAINEFFGPTDLQGRENIIAIKGYNTGLHRTFNKITINDTTVFDSVLVTEDGSREKKITIPFITTASKETIIGNSLLSEFKSPKIELIMLVKNSEIQTLKFLDLCTIDFPLEVKPSGSNDLPIYGVTKYGSGVYPRTQGAVSISPLIAFKVIEFKESVRNMTTWVKLRQRGKGTGDGTLNSVASYYGIAIYDENTYSDDPSYERAVTATYGAGEFDTAKYGG